jgi:ADP-ribose pyrophosphatase YjhB (NUDIX family)
VDNNTLIYKVFLLQFAHLMKNEYFMGRPIKGGWIDDDVFDKARRNLVIVTTDVLVVNQNKEVYLGYRNSAPAGYWWIFGGRMMAGESLQESAARCLKSELDIVFKNDQLISLGFYSIYWNDNTNIDHVLLVGFALEVDSKIKLNVPERHLASKWFSFDEVLSGQFHPCIKQMIKDYDSLLVTRH